MTARFLGKIKIQNTKLNKSFLLLVPFLGRINSRNKCAINEKFVQLISAVSPKTYNFFFMFFFGCKFYFFFNNNTTFFIIVYCQ